MMSVHSPSWLDQYKVEHNEDGTVDIFPPKPDKFERRTLRFYDYQLDYLVKNFNADNISESLRLALDELIKVKNNIRSIVLVSEERR